MATAKDIIVFIVVLFALGIGFFVTHYSMTLMTNELVANPVINASNQSVASFNTVKTSVNRLDYVIFGVFIGLLLSLIIASWFVAGNPLFMIIYFLVVVITIVAASIMANVWETVSQSSTFIINGIPTITYFPITNNLLLYSPYYMGVVGFLGLIVMFAKPYLAAQK